MLIFVATRSAHRQKWLDEKEYIKNNGKLIRDMEICWSAD